MSHRERAIHRPRALPGLRGFTLPELLVAVIVGLLVLAGVHRIFVAGLTTQTTTSLQTEVNRKAQVAMDDVIMRLRGGSSVVEAQPNRVWFIDQNGDNCRYWVDAGTLYRYCAAEAGSYSGGVRVASSVSGRDLGYYDQEGEPAASNALIARVEVSIEISRGGHTALLHSAAKLRNK
jgi:prepilin-type N-terminal cleavage/methylation domain-containing protein